MKRPSTIDEYTKFAPEFARPHLRQLRAILKEVAPKAKEGREKDSLWMKH